MRFWQGFLVVLFMGFMTPVLYGELTVNYSFVLLPAFNALLQGRISRPPGLFVAALVLYVFIFCASFVGRTELYGETPRRIASFVVFLSYFSYIFITVDRRMIAAFKVAVVGIGCCFSLANACAYFAAGGSELNFAAKDVVGDQRFGAVYVLGAWIVFLWRTEDLRGLVVKYLLLAALAMGILLTFSRGAIVALLGSAVLFVAVSLARWLVRADMRNVMKSGAVVVAVVAVVLLLRSLLPTSFDFFAERLFQPENAQAEIVNASASGGIRLAMAGQIVRYIQEHPLTGSGYLGVWVLPDTPEGVNSAHNQYADILFRTGLLGFAGFLGLLSLLLHHLYRTERSIFWGIVGVLICMIFHDIFKESEGAFILAFLFGMLAQSMRCAPGRAGAFPQPEEREPAVP